jgi:DMSO/TMAO reductase YedYZ molybdopterin-dependent catalytic subunit
MNVRDSDAVGGINRRRFLTLGAAVCASPIQILQAAAQAVPDAPSARRLLQLNGYALDAETPLDLLTSYLTPNDLFFVRSHWTPTRVDAATWKLTIDGAVSAPLTLSLTDLKAMPKVDATCVLQCSGNGRYWFSPPLPGVQWRYGAVGNARWSGVRVKDLLARAGISRTARHLHSFGGNAPPGQVPPFHRSIEIEKVLQDGVIAYEMNGQPLPHDHGAPARLVVPGWAGDHWMKWLRRLSASPDPQTGFYMDTAYRYPSMPGAPGQPIPPAQTHPITGMFVKSNITSAPSQARVGRAASVGGLAFSGAPDIARVEITDDDGATWKNARLDPQHDPYAWRLWTHQWTPSKPGPHRLTVRATDSRGARQPEVAPWNPGGYLYNSWHSVTVDVAS